LSKKSAAVANEQSDILTSETPEGLNPLKSGFCNIDGRMFHVHG
jgi:hypothetical protein